MGSNSQSHRNLHRRARVRDHSEVVKIVKKRTPLDILLVGLNHKTTPLEVRERISFSKEQLHDALPLLKDKVGECVILSTCNRTELYTAVDNPAKAVGQIWRFMADFHGLTHSAVPPYLYDYTGADAVRHLFRVASGLDSMIVGESQILGQVRNALRLASESQSVQVSLVGLFHAAVRVGRRAREETKLGRNALSISYTGVQLAQRILGTLQGLRVLLIGAGEAGQLVAKALRTVGVGDLMISNRTLTRAEELAQSLGGRVIPFLDIEGALSNADIVITATDSPELIITRDMVASLDLGRRGSTLFLFDLALPRDVDPQVAALEGVKLCNIDDLSSIAEENLEERQQAAIEVEAIVEDEMERFMRWWDSLDAVPIVKMLWQQAEEIREREVVRALRKLPNLPPQQLQVIDALTRSVVKKLLHYPTASLKHSADKSELQMARNLFRLWGESNET